MTEIINKYLQEGFNYAIQYGIQITGAIIVLIVGLWIIKKITNGTSVLMQKRNIDESLRPFLTSLLTVTLKALLVISVMSMVGIEMTSFIAILGAAGLAVGMALSGTLQNFAGGVMILIFKPFKVGDFIEAQGHSGSVKAIQIFNTILTTPDNKTIIIPNGGLSTSSMINFSTQKTRRVDFVFGIAYGDNLNKAKDIISNIVNQDSRIFKEPKPFVRLSELGDSSVNISTKIWVNAVDYWDVYFDTMETIYEQFNTEKINIPFPQMDVHIHKDTKQS